MRRALHACPAMPCSCMVRRGTISFGCKNCITFKEKPLKKIKTRRVVLQRLKELRDMNYAGPIPRWLQGNNRWGLAVKELAGAAVDYLEDEFDYQE
jgi:hypothetical protein